MLGGPAALAKAATGGTPAHLTRSAYLPLAGQKFRIGGKLMQLGVVDDLAGAADDTALRGHPEAFALTFYGPPNALGATVQTFTHPALGTYSLFITAVGSAEGQLQRYEVVVDRSVGRPADPPAPSSSLSPPDAHPGSPEAAEKALAEFRAEVAHESRRIARRAAAKRRRVKRRKLKRRRTATRSATKVRAATKRRASRAGYTAVRRGSATLIG